MLEKVDLTKSLTKDEYKERLDELQTRLFTAHRWCHQARIGSIVLFEGWDAAGKGTSISRLTERMDPRGFTVHPISAPERHEAARPWLWRYWLRLPAYGHMAIFDRSWYGRVLVQRVEKMIPERVWQQAYQDIRDFERMITDDGLLLVKFWLHIDRKEQGRRLKKLSKSKTKSWKVAAEDWEHHGHYKRYLLAADEMLARTETAEGPWTIVEATCRYWTRIKVLETVVRSLEDALERKTAKAEA
jgi:polyphosphate kinase 2 (PPK2 family)